MVLGPPLEGLSGKIRAASGTIDLGILDFGYLEDNHVRLVPVQEEIYSTARDGQAKLQ